MILSSSVGVGSGVSINGSVMDGDGGDLIDVVVVIPAIVAAVVIVGVGVIGLRGTTMFFMVFVFSVAGSFSSSAWSGGSFSLSVVAGLFFLSWSHKGLNRRHCYG